ncbi:rod shape-determining protein MreD [Phaeobacter inhibens]|uniref:Rod shape-determining protein MreD n=2 Tax=Roseobacteraceae TaxID=2854170 RepID=A0ABN5GLA8_9RHOB|nr:rod shape-determining protein MreD [Phaeobacter inhibens]AUQ48987.1 rod shape-determining protein MreD [Phaeobacter inhibens]AUQ55238.1 rod shape-determining protein MreD [Phaeobacter inhibens]AUQ71417.1 rod shape-determining protein MreD [Phaeobacter inhibens]AUQ79254.1 rod shape-determining protein MreD [Phaeobacter inhibens]
MRPQRGPQMANNAPARIWVMRAAFPALALVIMFFHLLPLDTLPSRWAPPDLLLALVMAWSMRRPDYVPTVLIALTFLLADLLFQRPPGLMALLVVLACSFLKSQVQPHRETAFIGEWVTVAITITAVTLLNRLILAVLGVVQPSLGLILIQMVATLLIYPLVALASQSLLGVRKLSPAEAEALGSR